MNKDWQKASKNEINNEIFRLRGLTMVCDRWPCAITRDGMSIDPVVDVIKGSNGDWIPATEEDERLYTNYLPVMIMDGRTGIWPPRQSPRGDGILEAWVLPATFYPDDILGTLVLITELRKQGFGISITSESESAGFKCSFFKDNYSYEAISASLPTAISIAYVMAMQSVAKVDSEKVERGQPRAFKK